MIVLAAAAAPQPIEFDFIKSHIFVHARLNGRKGTWLLDSGANTSVVTARAAKRSNCPPVTIQVANDPYGMSHFVQAESIEVGTAKAGVPFAGVLPNLTDRILRTDGVFIDGIIGFDWLKQFRASIDYKARKLTLARPAEPAKPAPGRHLIPMDIVNGVPMVPVSINGGPVRPCLLDTGANILNIRWNMAKASGISPTDPAVQAGPRVRGLAGNQNTYSVQLKTLAVGKAVFGNVIVSIHDDAHLPWIFGTLGNVLFEQYRLTLDAKNKQVVLDR